MGAIFVLLCYFFLSLFWCAPLSAFYDTEIWLFYYLLRCFLCALKLYDEQFHWCHSCSYTDVWKHSSKEKKINPAFPEKKKWKRNFQFFIGLYTHQLSSANTTMNNCLIFSIRIAQFFSIRQFRRRYKLHYIATDSNMQQNNIEAKFAVLIWLAVGCNFAHRLSYKASARVN